jgi:hypothetical protein
MVEILRLCLEKNTEPPCVELGNFVKYSIPLKIYIVAK